MQDTFARARTWHKGWTAARPSARDDRVSCIHVTYPSPFLKDTLKFARALICQACDDRLGVVYCIYYVISQEGADFQMLTVEYRGLAIDYVII